MESFKMDQQIKTNASTGSNDSVVVEIDDHLDRSSQAQENGGEDNKEKGWRGSLKPPWDLGLGWTTFALFLSLYLLFMVPAILYGTIPMEAEIREIVKESSQVFWDGARGVNSLGVYPVTVILGLATAAKLCNLANAQAQRANRIVPTRIRQFTKGYLILLGFLSFLGRMAHLPDPTNPKKLVQFILSVFVPDLLPWAVIMLSVLFKVAMDLTTVEKTCVAASTLWAAIVNMVKSAHRHYCGPPPTGPTDGSFIHPSDEPDEQSV